ncbi:hypothetical protein BCEP27_10657 [Burkholderia cepacia]
MLAFLGRHRFPLAPVAPAAPAVVSAEAAEQDAAQHEQAQRPGEIDRAGTDEQRRHHPVPQHHDDPSEHAYGDQDEHRLARASDSKIHLSTPLDTVQFVMNELQPCTQMQDRIAFAREQRIERNAALRGHLLEGTAFQFVRDKHLALIRRQLVERILQGFEQERARVDGFGAGIVRRQHEIQPVLAVRVVVGLGQIGQRLLLLLAKAVDDTVARRAEQPRAHLFDGRRKPVSLDELVKHVLKDVLGIVRVANPTPDEAHQPRSFTHHYRGDVAVWVGHVREVGGDSMHLKTFQAREYCGECEK